MTKSKKTYRSDSNRNSRIVTQSTSPRSMIARETFTSRRDEGSLLAIARTESNNSTSFTIERAGAQLQLDGNEARTLFSVLAKHYYGV